jgi:bifunctional non-homologous end joining protein LigD
MYKYILVKHEALKRGIHYDLRFQMPNSKNWASFALNELPPTEPGKRIYIPRTTDHSERDALYLGKIDEGEYGAGKLTKVESGNCDILKFTNAHIIVKFHGKKLDGTYHFINAGLFSRKKDFTKKVYSFFKAKGEINLAEEYLIFLNECYIEI